MPKDVKHHEPQPKEHKSEQNYLSYASLGHAFVFSSSCAESRSSRRFQNVFDAADGDDDPVGAVV